MESFDDDDVIIIGSGLFMQMLLEEEEKGRRSGIDNYLKERGFKGRFVKDFDDLSQSKTKFKENFRMDVDIFEELTKFVVPFLLPKRNTRIQDAISPKVKLAAVLEYLGCGSLQRHIASTYRISKQHFGLIITDVCTAIADALQSEIPPITKEEVLEKGNKFYQKWNFPNCVGAIDGKHVSIKCPRNSGSLCFNYKGFHSLVLMAVADAEYCFTYLDIGALGSEGDAAVFAHCSLGKALTKNTLEFPEDATVGGVKMPYFFVADDAFPLNKRIIKPFTPKKHSQLENSERIFNYRLSRARRCVENAFGILCSRWMCLAKSMFCSPDKAQKIITACCYLHNFLIKKNGETYCPPRYADTYDKDGNLIEGEWRGKIPNNSIFRESVHFNQGRPNENGKQVRENLKNFVNSPEGSVPWQRSACFL